MKVKVKPESLKSGQFFDAVSVGKGGYEYREVVFKESNTNTVLFHDSAGKTGTLKMESYTFFREMTHPEMVSILAKPGAAILKSLTPEKCNLLHMVSCILGETAELLNADPGDRPNIMEELGDIRFYLQGFCAEINAEVPQFTHEGMIPVTFTAVCGQLVIHAGNLFDATKKHIFYEADLDRKKVENCVIDLCKTLALIEYKMNITTREVLEHNIDKLMNKRYPDGYSDKAALARADKQPDPPQQWLMGKPQHIDSEDCMGNPLNYWRVFAKDPNSSKEIQGTGIDAEQAKRDCQDNVQKFFAGK